ncbi:MAG: hypothetical protein AAF657_30010, partial [Acidobacteriota bacterium]
MHLKTCRIALHLALAIQLLVHGPLGASDGASHYVMFSHDTFTYRPIVDWSRPCQTTKVITERDPAIFSEPGYQGVRIADQAEYPDNSPQSCPVCWQSFADEVLVEFSICPSSPGTAPAQEGADYQLGYDNFSPTGPPVRWLPPGVRVFALTSVSSPPPPLTVYGTSLLIDPANDNPESCWEQPEMVEIRLKGATPKASPASLMDIGIENFTGNWVIQDLCACTEQHEYPAEIASGSGAVSTGADLYVQIEPIHAKTKDLVEQAFPCAASEAVAEERSYRIRLNLYDRDEYDRFRIVGDPRNSPGALHVRFRFSETLAGSVTSYPFAQHGAAQDFRIFDSTGELSPD